MEKPVKYRSAPQLPSDVMLDIFCRLPAGSVGRFRTVSKLYNRLLCQPSFVNDHLRHGSHVKLLVTISVCKPEAEAKKTWYIYYPIHNNNNITSSEVINYSSYGIVDDSISLIGPCNGLFCVLDYEGLLTLWNPTTSEASCVPELPDEDNKLMESWFIVNNLRRQYSLGYDSSNDDYKIVCVICVYKKDKGRVKNPSTSKTYIYSTKRRFWKKIEPFPPYCMGYTCGNQFVHGNIHWIAYSCADEDGRKKSQVIVSLDLANERYRTLPQLPRQYHPGDDLNVCVLGGELCVYINGEYKRDFEIWMMRGYGSVEQSWFQLLNIPFQNIQYCIHSRSAYCRPLFVLENGEILIEAIEYLGRSVYLYNPKTCNFITIHTTNLLNDLLLGHVYDESLVETGKHHKQ